MADQPTTPMRPPVLDRFAALVGAWALRRLYGACLPGDRDDACRSCWSAELIRDMEDIARGK